MAKPWLKSVSAAGCDSRAPFTKPAGVVIAFCCGVRAYRFTKLQYVEKRRGGGGFRMSFNGGRNRRPMKGLAKLRNDLGRPR